ncbi:MAG: hypothetical protein HOP30_14880 [Cyclobacteriaceae bacterium]|nr:hypothetical protein [Cyclobacteriaceae bacterium]
MKINWRLLIALVLSSGVLAFGALFYNSTITPFDRPFFLSSVRETIIATKVNWMCHCANFVDTTNYKIDPIAEPKENDYFFIEMSDGDHLGEDFFVENKYVKLTGKFYIDRGIPEEFKLGHIEDKPDHARVFKVEKMEVVTKGAVH